jgi:hypothetical protein
MRISISSRLAASAIMVVLLLAIVTLRATPSCSTTVLSIWQQGTTGRRHALCQARECEQAVSSASATRLTLLPHKGLVHPAAA